MKNGDTILVVAAFFVLLLALTAYAAPTATDGAGIVSSERKPTSSGGTGVQSQAGNTTQLAVNGTRVTSNWQGYYGNVSGDITLDDADSNTLYSWGLTSISGEIFAVNTSATVNWANITCVNLTNATSPQIRINESTLNQQYFISEADMDKFNRTFTGEFSGSVNIGTINIDATDNCPRTYLFVNNQSQSTDYQEILLFDNKSALVYTSILEPAGTTGFDNLQYNFEMLVAQQNASTGTYYFYVELS